MRNWNSLRDALLTSRFRFAHRSSAKSTGSIRVEAIWISAPLRDKFPYQFRHLWTVEVAKLIRAVWSWATGARKKKKKDSRLSLARSWSAIAADARGQFRGGGDGVDDDEVRSGDDSSHPLSVILPRALRRWRRRGERKDIIDARPRGQKLLPCLSQSHHVHVPCKYL